VEKAEFLTVLRPRALGEAGAAATRSLPLTVTLGVALYLAWGDRGSIAVGSFAPLAVIVGLLTAAILASGSAARPPRAVLVAGAALTTLAAWAAISGFWAAVPSLARDEALLVAFGLLALLVPTLTAHGPLDRLAGLGVVVAGVALMALATALVLHGSTGTFDDFRYRRLSFPITYANASAGLFLVAFWPAVVLAGRRGAALWVRIPSFATASLVLATSILAQSKGAIVGLAVSTIVLAAVAPARLRLLLAAALAALPVAIAFTRLTAPYTATSDAAELSDIHTAAFTLLALTIGGGVLGTTYILCDRRLDLNAGTRRRIGRGVTALAAAALVLGCVGFGATAGNPAHWLSGHWRSFKHAPSRTAAAQTHLVELGSNRYDFWRVALGEWRRHPIVGDGARGFGPAYLAHGRSSEQPARAHSLPLDLLGEEGLVGFGLATVAYLTLLVALARRARRRSAAATAALAGCTLLLAQACVDWTFTFPALIVLFFLLAGIGLADDREPPATGRRLAPVVAALALALIGFAPPWVSARLVRDGLAARDGNDLRWAHRWDPVSIDPWIAQAQIAATPAAAEAPLLLAESRAPRSLAVHYLLGSVYFNAHRKRDAVREFEIALRLHRTDAAVKRALAIVRAR
jgi:hypothetical protein